jgi:hypothetical protein
MPQAKTQSPPGYTPGVAWNNTPVVGAASQSTSTTTSTSALLPPGPACQPCPECGGLVCLCRPRFFAGQLLTEQDLNRLDQYIVAKNQLHNRYLVGQGVVCGLDVTCSPCSNTVSVSAGYAIDTCGNDIIVCSPDTVDICSLIKACTPATQMNCAPYKDQTACQETVQNWILAIRYRETPSRGITPLTGSSQCSCGSSSACSCGCSTSKPCACGSQKSAASCCGQTMASTMPVTNNLPRRGAPPSCEPTLTCEAYCYEVFLAPTTTVTKPSPVRGIAGLASTIGGELFANIECCVRQLLANLPTMPGTGATAADWVSFCCNLRLALIQYIVANGSTNCQALAELQATTCPSATDPNFGANLLIALERELIILIELILDCVCSAALPPCPCPGDPRVPLASVQVRASDCTILSVCDWTPLRKHVVTTKTLGYWLGWLPFVPLLRQFMHELCCSTLRLPEQFFPTQREAGAAATGAAPAAGAAARMSAAATRTAASAPGASPGAPTAPAAPTTPAAESNNGQGLDTPVTLAPRTYQASNPISQALLSNLAGSASVISVGDLFHALLDPIDPTAPAANLAAMPHARVLAEIARPLVSSLGPLISAAGGNASAPAGGAAPTAPGAAAPPSGSAPTQTQTTDAATTMAAMRAELDALKTTVTSQQAALDALRNPPASAK